MFSCLQHKDTRKREGCEIASLYYVWRLFLSSLLFLEVLVVFDCAPGATPAEAVLDEETVAGVGGVDEGDWNFAVGGAVGGVGLAVGWLHLAVVEVDVRVVEGIDVDGESLGVLGELGGA